MVKANDDGACLRLAHAQVEVQTKSTFICGINGVGGGGGGGTVQNEISQSSVVHIQVVLTLNQSSA